MSEWVTWFAIYCCVGFLMGEIYIAGRRKTRRSVECFAYVIGVALWPVVVLIILNNARKQI